MARITSFRMAIAGSSDINCVKINSKTSFTNLSGFLRHLSLVLKRAWTNLAPCGSRIDGSRKRSPMETRRSLSKGCRNYSDLTGVKPSGTVLKT